MLACFVQEFCKALCVSVRDCMSISCQCLRSSLILNLTLNTYTFSIVFTVPCSSGSGNPNLHTTTKFVLRSPCLQDVLGSSWQRFTWTTNWSHDMQSLAWETWEGFRCKNIWGTKKRNGCLYYPLGFSF